MSHSVPAAVIPVVVIILLAIWLLLVYRAGELADLATPNMIAAPCGPDPDVHADGARALAG